MGLLQYVNHVFYSFVSHSAKGLQLDLWISPQWVIIDKADGQKRKTGHILNSDIGSNDSTRAVDR